MKTTRIDLKRIVVLAALILAGSSMHSLAQTLLLARGRIESMDRTNMTLTIKQAARKEPLTLYITSRTRLFKNAEPAITSDLVVGDEVRGSARKDSEGKIEAVRIYVAKAEK